MTVPPSKFDWEDIFDDVIHHGDFINDLFKMHAELKAMYDELKVMCDELETRVRFQEDLEDARLPYRKFPIGTVIPMAGYYDKLWKEEEQKAKEQKDKEQKDKLKK
jgi:hypothetical protein